MATSIRFKRKSFGLANALLGLNKFAQASKAANLAKVANQAGNFDRAARLNAMAAGAAAGGITRAATTAAIGGGAIYGASKFAGATKTAFKGEMGDENLE